AFQLRQRCADLLRRTAVERRIGSLHLQGCQLLFHGIDLPRNRLQLALQFVTEFFLCCRYWLAYWRCGSCRFSLGRFFFRLVTVCPFASSPQPRRAAITHTILTIADVIVSR